jgi:hypothetical protein
MWEAESVTRRKIARVTTAELVPSLLAKAPPHSLFLISCALVALTFGR